MLQEMPVIECPDCHQPFVVVMGTTRCGIAACHCLQVAMESDVVVSTRNPTGESVAAAVCRGDSNASRLLPRRYSARLRMLEMIGVSVTYRRYLRHAVLGRLMTNGPSGRFFDRFGNSPLLKPFWGAGQWNLYMRHRFVTPSFLAARAAIGLVSGRSGLVLDAPCGMGHLSHYLGRTVAPDRIVAMDLDPASAYATRRFFAPDAASVLAWDMNDPLPLPSERFGAIFCVDAFHYVERKHDLAREFGRLLTDDGVLAILHLHNRLRDNPTPGTPLSPSEYADLFPGLEVRMYPEEHFLRASLADSRIDLTSSAPLAELERANAIMLLAAKRGSSLNELPSLGDVLADDPINPQVNELYELRTRGDDVVLELSIPATLAWEYPQMREALPNRVIATRSRQFAERLAFDEQHDLLKRNVLVDVPTNF